MTTIEHTHTEFTTKDEMSDFKVTVTNMMTQLSQANLAANARVDRLEARMDRLEEEMREIRSMIQDLIDSTRALTETNRRAIGFATSENE